VKSVFRRCLNVCSVLDSRIPVGSLFQTVTCRCGETEDTSAKVCGMRRNK